MQNYFGEKSRDTNMDSSLPPEPQTPPPPLPPPPSTPVEEINNTLAVSSPPSVSLQDIDKQAKPGSSQALPPSPPSSATPIPQEPKKEKRGGCFKWGCLILLLIPLLIVVGYFGRGYYNGYKENKKFELLEKIESRSSSELIEDDYSDKTINYSEYVTQKIYSEIDKTKMDVKYSSEQVSGDSHLYDFLKSIDKSKLDKNARIVVEEIEGKEYLDIIEGKHYPEQSSANVVLAESTTNVDVVTGEWKTLSNYIEGKDTVVFYSDNKNSLYYASKKEAQKVSEWSEKSMTTYRSWGVVKLPLINKSGKAGALTNVSKIPIYITSNENADSAGAMWPEGNTDGASGHTYPYVVVNKSTNSREEDYWGYKRDECYKTTIAHELFHVVQTTQFDEKSYNDRGHPTEPYAQWASGKVFQNNESLAHETLRFNTKRRFQEAGISQLSSISSSGYYYFNLLEYLSEKKGISYVLKKEFIESEDIVKKIKSEFGVGGVNFVDYNNYNVQKKFGNASYNLFDGTDHILFDSDNIIFNDKDEVVNFDNSGSTHYQSVYPLAKARFYYSGSTEGKSVAVNIDKGGEDLNLSIFGVKNKNYNVDLLKSQKIGVANDVDISQFNGYEGLLFQISNSSLESSSYYEMYISDTLPSGASSVGGRGCNDIYFSSLWEAIAELADGFTNFFEDLSALYGSGTEGSRESQDIASEWRGRADVARQEAKKTKGQGLHVCGYKINGNVNTKSFHDNFAENYPGLKIDYSRFKIVTEGTNEHMSVFSSYQFQKGLRFVIMLTGGLLDGEPIDLIYEVDFVE